MTDEFSDEMAVLVSAEKSVADAASAKARIGWSAPARNIMNELSTDDQAQVQAVIDGMLANLDADDNPKLPGSHFMVLDVNDHLRLVYSKNYSSDEHRGYSLLTIARQGGQMWKFTDDAVMA